MTPLDLTIVIPSAYRPAALSRCLDGLARQTVLPRATVVALRSDDAEGEEVCARFEQRQTTVVRVETGGVVVAMKAGLAAVDTEWVAFLDDDAEPAPSWCERASRYLTDTGVGCFGGRIFDLHGARTTARWIDASRRIAYVDAFGRPLSHLHDIPVIPRVEDVDFLPGANLFIRTVLARSADHGRAPGLAPGEELEWCFSARDKGFRVIYDSSLVVAHYPSPRKGSTPRDDSVAYAFEYAYMMSYVLARHRRGFSRALSLAYFSLVGLRASPGFLLLGPCALRPTLGARWRAAMKGRFQGLADAIHPADNGGRPAECLHSRRTSA